MPELVDVTPGSPEWLAARRQGITATDLPAILGISPYDSPYSLYWRKQGAIPDVPDCPRFALGRYLEPYIAEGWAIPRGLPFISGHVQSAGIITGGLYRSTERPWQLATVDHALVEPAAPYFTAVLELKSWADMDRDRWDNGPPATVRAQVLWQMDVMGVPVGHVAVLFLPSGDLKSFVIEHGPECAWRVVNPASDLTPGHCTACADLKLMRDAGHEFMYRLTDGTAPDADGSAASLAAARARFTPTPNKVAVIDPGIWEDYTDWDDALAAAKTMRTLNQVRVREQAGDCGDLEVDGQLVARFDKRGALRRIKAKENDL